MKIDIIGSNTINGIKLRKKIIKIVNNVNEKVIINLVDEHEINNLPILYINNRFVSEGKIPSEKELLKYLKNIIKNE